MIIKTPTTYYITTGDSEGYSPLNAFDKALLRAGIGNTNLVRMSSICPPGAVQVESVDLPHGALVPVAYASITSSNPGEVIAAAVAIAFPEDESHAGLIMEYSAAALKEVVEKEVIKMAEEGMTTMRGKKIKEIKSAAMEHTVKEHGCAFAAVVLWD